MNPLHAIRQLDYTVIFCRNLPAMRRFYSDVMCFSLERELSPSWLEYRIGPNILALTQRGALWRDPAPAVGALSLQLAFRVTPDQVDACAESLRAAGVRIEQEPTDQAFGHRTLFFRDPDGNVLEIYGELG